MDKTSLGDRIKKYEQIFDHAMLRRLPIIVRVDGKGFSRWTKKQKLEKPFDSNLCHAMSTTMLDVASSIEGCVFAYTQSDEMTFIMRNDQSVESEPWLGNRTQKINSIISSMVTAHFNAKMHGPLAFFDCRVFLVPSIVEACNAVIWRQNDATKNSISSACYYEVGKVVGRGTARKLMHGLNQKQQQELLFQRANINWNDYPTKYKRGIACYKILKEKVDNDGNTIIRKPWYLDLDIPVFTKQQEFLYEKLGFDNA